MTPAAPALRLDNLSITLPDGRTLLRGVTLEVGAGELVLIAGPSGSGKSTLLKLLAGFFEEELDGLQIQGHVEVNASKDRPAVGLVFQNLALFDELSAQQNVQFAIDHRGTPGRADEAAARLKDLGVPVPGILRRLSGGERQRVAVARTMAMDPPILLFDEPTTGLDPYRARAVADLIATTHRTSGKTVVVVTHDVGPFLEHRPRLLLLDPTAAVLRAVTADEMTQYFEAARDGTIQLPPHSAARRRRLAWLDEPGNALRHVVAAAVTPARGWSRPAWKLRYLFHYLRMVLIGPTAVYVALAGAMLGFVTVFFGVSDLPYVEVTRPLLIAELLAAMGSSAFRVLVPLLTTILLAGKCGAAISADIGARRLTQQFEALRSFGAHPAHYFHGNIVIAMAVAAPALAMIAYGANCYASLVAFLLADPEATTAVFSRNFYDVNWPAGRTLPYDLGWFTLKTLCCGVLIGAFGYALGARPKAAATDVSRDVGHTIFWASLGVLAIHAGFAFIEF